MYCGMFKEEREYVEVENVQVEDLIEGSQPSEYVPLTVTLRHWCLPIFLPLLSGCHEANRLPSPHASFAPHPLSTDSKVTGPNHSGLQPLKLQSKIKLSSLKLFMSNILSQRQKADGQIIFDYMLLTHTYDVSVYKIIYCVSTVIQNILSCSSFPRGLLPDKDYPRY